MLRIATLVALLAVPARADIVPPAQPRFDTPAPRTIRDANGERLRELPVFVFLNPQAPISPDPDVALRSERVRISMYERLLAVESELELEGGDHDVESLRVAVAADVDRQPRVPIFALHAVSEGHQLRVERHTQIREDGRAREERWWEWRVRVPAHARVRVRVSYAAPYVWMGIEGGELRALPIPDPDGYARVLIYDRAPSSTWRSAPASTAIHVELHARGRLQLTPHAATEGGRSADLTLENGEARIEARLTPQELDQFAQDDPVPPWLRLLDTLAYGSPDPTRGRDPENVLADAWLTRIEALQESLRHGGREARFARGVLRQVRRQLDFDPADDRRIGWMGAEVGEDEWERERIETRAWLTPPGEEVSMPPPQDDSSPEAEGERFAASAMPPFGHPNAVLLVHSRLRRGERGLWWLAGLSAVGLLAIGIWRARRRKISPRATL